MLTSFTLGAVAGYLNFLFCLQVMDGDEFSDEEMDIVDGDDISFPELDLSEGDFKFVGVKVGPAGTLFRNYYEQQAWVQFVNHVRSCVVNETCARRQLHCDVSQDAFQASVWIV